MDAPIDISVLGKAIADAANIDIPGHTREVIPEPAVETAICDECHGPMSLHSVTHHSNRRGMIRQYLCSRCNVMRTEQRSLVR